MSYQLIIFPDPINATCTLRTDAGDVFTGVAAVHPSGRAGQGFLLPDTTANQNGALLTIAAPTKVTLTQRGILFLRDGIAYPWTTGQTAAFSSDDFRLVSANTTLPRLVVQGEFLAQEIVPEG